jgi:hypothetical protein
VILEAMTTYKYCIGTGYYNASVEELVSFIIKLVNQSIILAR